MFTVRDTLLNLIIHSLTANNAERKGRTHGWRDREMGSSVSREVGTSYKQWTLHEKIYIIHSYNKYARVTNSSTLKKQLCLFLHLGIHMLIYFVLYVTDILRYYNQ